MHSRFIPCALLALAFSGVSALAQTQAPGAPTAQQTPGPSSAPAAGEGPQFPPVNQANFTASAPGKEEVEAFLKTSWGYDSNRVWEVYGIEKTAAPGVSKVTILVAEKQNPQQVASLVFFVTPDGKHLITQQSILDFGPDPYAANRRLLQQQAEGPSRGVAGKQFELVEFADFQCPHCKEAEPVAEKLVQDFPQAHFVFESFPLVNVHPEAFKAAAWGACVAQQNGNAAFFKYAETIFAAQNDLAGQEADQALRNAATAAGASPDKIAGCADSAAAKSAVDASKQLGDDLNVNETPTLFIDGRAMPMMAVPYEQLKKIVAYQFALDQQK